MEDLFIQLIEKAAKKGLLASVTTGKVSNISGDVCDVEREGLPTLLGVSMTCIDTNSNSYVKTKPTDGSVVAVAIINGIMTEGVIVATSEIESIEILINNNKVILDDSGIKAELATGKFTIKNQTQDLKSILQDLITAIGQITIPLAPSGTGIPINVASFPPIATRLNTLFN
jgi:hypothetical protein